ncbi:MAG TPA: hypothetical protein VJT80_11940 [Steroidobacteraceae bacterium]|nr:hypothetical protein [Steroidobacteraceae bacterium]
MLKPVLALLLASLILAGCGGGGGREPAVTPPPLPPPASVLISGSEAALVSAVLTQKSDHPLAAQDVSGNFLLTRMAVLFTPTATVGQVNAAARVVGAASITSSESGSLFVTLEVPRQSSVAAMQTLAKTMRAQPGIALAWPGEMAKAAVLPAAPGGSPVDISSLTHLRANRFPQAWNARQAIGSDCLPHSVNVYVTDLFGPASLRPEFFDQIDRGSFFADPAGMASDNIDGHGYDVASTLAARFDTDLPTGANPFPDCVVIHAAEFRATDYLASVRRALLAVAADGDPRVILTSSVVHNNDGFCGPNSDQPCDAQTVPTTPVETFKVLMGYHAAVAGEWSRLTRTRNLQDKMLVTQAAGNVDGPPDGFLPQNYLGFRSASLASPAALATHIGELQAMLTDPALWKSATQPSLPDVTFSANEAALLIQNDPDLAPATTLDARNLLIVDSGSNKETLEEVTQSDFDFLGANVRAVGEGVVLFGRVEPGTSFSTPEVAGLAAYLWNLSSALSNAPPSATVDLIKRTSRTTANSPTVPVVDAYAAVLQLDNAASEPVRRGLVDVDGDGGFTALDLQKFAEAYGLADPNTPTIPSARDFSRLDLNGDGFTGGVITTAFDLDVNGLDANGHAILNSANETLEGYEIAFNEAALSDLQILCYYAYSPLYASDNGGQNDQVRTQLLGPDHCVGARMNMQLPAQIAAPTPMTVDVEVPAGQGQFAPAENVLVELTPTCASVNPSSGRTDANGAISTVLTPAPGCTSASLQATARADAGTPILASQSATTTITNPARTSYAAVSIDERSGVPGVLRASFSDLDPSTSNLTTVIQFTAPVSDVASFMSRVRETLAGIGEIGTLNILLVDEGLPIQLDLPGVTVGNLGLLSSCRSTVNVAIGDARPNAAGSITTGMVSTAGCGTMTVRAGAVVSVNIANTSNLDLRLQADSVSSGITIGNVQAVVASTLDLTVGATDGFSIRNTRDSTVRIQGSASGGLNLIGNRNLTLGSTLESPGLTHDLQVDDNTFNGPSLSLLQVGSMRDLTITNNIGFSDTDARAFADAHTISGTTTIGNNRP